MTPQATITHSVKRFERALMAYDTGVTLEECLIDLLADARHWCERNKRSFLDLDRMAFRFYLNDRKAGAGEGK